MFRAASGCPEALHNEDLEEGMDSTRRNGLGEPLVFGRPASALRKVFRAWSERVRTGRSAAAAARELAALSPWLRRDLGVGRDGDLLDRRRRG